MVDSKVKENVSQNNAVQINEQQDLKKDIKLDTDEEKIEEEKSGDDEAEEEVVDAENTWGNEDPSEIEVEAFCLPPSSAIIDDICEHVKRRRLCVFPLKITDLNHPAIIESIDKCLDFKTSYVKIFNENQPETWNGILEMTFKTGYVATDAAEYLKTIREDIQVKIVNENLKKLSEHWIAEASLDVGRSMGHLLCVKRIRDDMSLSQLKKAFDTASEIIVPKPIIGSRIAYIFFDTEDQLKEALERYTNEAVVINDVKLKIIKYQPPHFPQGLLKMKRRYKVLLQIHELQKALKNKDGRLTDSNRTKINTTIESCQLTIEKDDKVRESIGMKLWTYKELRSIKPLRESDVAETIWLPSKVNQFDEEENDKNKHKWSDKKTKEAGVPSLLEMPIPSNPVSSFHPMARVQEIAATLANMARGGTATRGAPTRPGRGGMGGNDRGNANRRDNDDNKRGWSNNRNQPPKDNFQSRQNNKRARSPPPKDGRFNSSEPRHKMERDDRKSDTRWAPRNNQPSFRNQQPSSFKPFNQQQQQQPPQQQQNNNYNQQPSNFNQQSSYNQQPDYSQPAYNAAAATAQQPAYDAQAYMQPQQTQQPAYNYDYTAYNQQASYGYSYAQPPAPPVAGGAAYAGADQQAAWNTQQVWAQPAQWPATATADPSQASAVPASDQTTAASNYAAAYNWGTTPWQTK